MLGLIFFPKPDTWVTFGILMFCLKGILLILQGSVSMLLFKKIKNSINHLRTGTLEEIWADYEKYVD
jgi:hypothetical protein